MKGFRTVALGAAMAVVPPTLTYLGGIDWTQILAPNAAMALSGALTIAMRCLTTTAVGTK